MDNGRKIFNKGMEWKNGMTDPSMRATFMRESSRDKERITGVMVPSTMDYG